MDILEKGQPLELNKEFDGLISVAGIFPRGQMGMVETNYSIMVQGMELRIPESLLYIIFKVPSKPQADALSAADVVKQKKAALAEAQRVAKEAKEKAKAEKAGK